MANPTRLSSLKDKEKDISKKNTLYNSTTKAEDTEALGKQRAKLSKIKARYSDITQQQIDI